MVTELQKSDGFAGEKLIKIPKKVLKETMNSEPGLLFIYISQIGYFPKATFHYRERPDGCEDNILIYCVQGKGHFKIDGYYFEITCDQFVLIPATNKYMRYWADKNDPWTIYWIHYTGDGINAFNRAFNINIGDTPVYVRNNLKRLEIWQNIYQILEKGFNQDNVRNATFHLYHLLATFLFRENELKTDKKRKKDLVSNVIHAMRDNIGQRLSVEDMAADNHISVSHFSALFRKATGMAPIDYFISIKMQKACELLHTSDEKVMGIAAQLGYDDPYYFSRIFKKHIGLSPIAYRTNLQS
jgi:AraC-like DNA-binding protein